MKRLLFCFVIAFMALGLQQCSKFDIKKEKKVKRENIPQPVLHTLRELYPEGEILQSIVVRRGGETKYRFSMWNEERRLEVKIEPDGKLDDIEEELNLDEVPENIKKAIASEFSEFSLQKAERKIEQGGAFYQVRVNVVERGNKIKYELTFKEDAELIEKKIKV